MVSSSHQELMRGRHGVGDAQRGHRILFGHGVRQRLRGAAAEVVMVCPLCTSRRRDQVCRCREKKHTGVSVLRG